MEVLEIFKVISELEEIKDYYSTKDVIIENSRVNDESMSSEIENSDNNRDQNVFNSEGVAKDSCEQPPVYTSDWSEVGREEGISGISENVDRD